MPHLYVATNGLSVWSSGDFGEIHPAKLWRVARKNPSDSGRNELRPARHDGEGRSAAETEPVLPGPAGTKLGHPRSPA